MILYRRTIAVIAALQLKLVMNNNTLCNASSTLHKNGDSPICPDAVQEFTKLAFEFKATSTRSSSVI